MSQEDIEVVRRMNAAFNRGDLDEAYGFYEPTAVWHSRADEPDTGDYHGLDAIREMAMMWVGMFDEFRFDLEDYVDGGDCVVTSGWLCGRGRESGAEVRRRMPGLSVCAGASSPKSGSTATTPRPSKPLGCRSRALPSGGRGTHLTRPPTPVVERRARKRVRCSFPPSRVEGTGGRSTAFWSRPRPLWPGSRRWSLGRLPRPTKKSDRQWPRCSVGLRGSGARCMVVTLALAVLIVADAVVERRWLLVRDLLIALASGRRRRERARAGRRFGMGSPGGGSPVPVGVP